MKRAMVNAIIKEQFPEYIKSGVKAKTKIIDNVEAITKMKRKSIIRAFARMRKQPNWKAPPKLGRPKFYSAETDAALCFIWEQYNYPCGERLYPDVSEAVRIFKRDRMWHYSKQATD